MLVLPGHGLPFRGLHARIDALAAHHAERCGRIARACRERPLTVAEILPHVFERALDEHQTGFAFGEVLAHVNYMLGRGELVATTDAGGGGPFPRRRNPSIRSRRGQGSSICGRTPPTS